MTDERPRILLVGDWAYAMYQEASARALAALGCTVVPFGWSGKFDAGGRGRVGAALRRIQFRVQSGPTIWALRRALVAATAREQPDVVFFYNVQLIDAATVRALRRAAPGAVLCQYANDNPFSAQAAPGLWRNFVASVPCFDLHFAYRQGNFEDFRRHGAREVHLLRSYFIPEEDFPSPPAERTPEFECDAVFAGHFEDDGRLELLEAIAGAGHRLKIRGGDSWRGAARRLAPSSPLQSLFPVRIAAGADYRRALCGSRVALGFLSRLNLDTYTRRNFQIPAMAVPMLAPYTADLASLFEPDREAVFYRDRADLLAKLAWLLADDGRRVAIGQAGCRRVWADGHDVTSRMRQFLAVVDDFRARQPAGALRTHV
jgi:spore maturation protein CgeB